MSKHIEPTQHQPKPGGLSFKSYKQKYFRGFLRKSGLAIALVFMLLSACAPAAQKLALEMPPAEGETIEEMISSPAGTIGDADKLSGAPEAAEQVPQDESQLLSAPSSTERMVIKDAVIDLLVGDTDHAVAQVTQLASEEGGYIIDARSWFDHQYKYAELKLGVPVANFEHTLNVIRDLGIEVTNEAVSGQDVSAEYNDLQSSLTNLEATAERVRGFLDQAQSIEEALTINQTLAELEAQIEQVKGKMRYYEGRSAFSTITVRLNPQIVAPEPTPPPPPPAWDPGRTFEKASAVTIKNMQRFIDRTIWFVVVYWPLVLFVLLGILIWRFVRRKASGKSMADAPSWNKKAAKASADGPDN